jgi:hypothetical protein
VGSGFCPIVRGHPRAMLAPGRERREMRETQPVLEKFSPNELLFL